MTPDDEERGWQELRGRWSEEGAHRAWLDGFTDLEGLARAGQRYRAHLVANAGDPVAARWLEEIVKRATVHGLASLPRTKPTPAAPRWLKAVAVVALVAVVAGTLLWIVRQLLALPTGR